MRRASTPVKEVARFETFGLGQSSLGGLFLLVLEVILLFILTFYHISDIHILAFVDKLTCPKAHFDKQTFERDD